MNPLAIIGAIAEIMPLAARCFQKDDQLCKHVADVATKLTGTDNPKHIVETLQKDPKLLLELYTAMLNSERELQDSEIKDRINARDFSQHDSFRVHIMLLIATSGLIICLGLLYQGRCNAETVGILSTACGIFGSCLKDVYAFQFGWRRKD